MTIKINAKIIATIGTSIIFLAVITGGGIVFNYDVLFNRDQILRSYASDIFSALDNQKCSSLYPVNQINGISDRIVCPRGDTGNFMVIDQVKYDIQSIIGNKYARERKVLVNVCIKAHGVAAWNEGRYEGCTTDPRIVTFLLNNFKWTLNLDDLTDISTLVSTAGAKPEDFDARQKRCIEIANSINFQTPCTFTTASDIRYAISHHKQAERGKAR